MFSGHGVSEFPHLRQRNKTAIETHNDTAPSIVYFQIEISGDSTSGALIEAEKEVHLKHMTTRQYLTVLPTDNENVYTVNFIAEKVFFSFLFFSFLSFSFSFSFFKNFS